MRDHYSQFQQRGAEVLAIAPDRPDAVRAYWERERIPFPGLIDSDHAVARRYGQQIRLLRFGRMPAVLIVDPAGVIRYRHDGRSMRDIPTVDDLLTCLDQLNQ